MTIVSSAARPRGHPLHRSPRASARTWPSARSLLQSWQSIVKFEDAGASELRSDRQVGVVLVDHGSRKASANEALQDFASLFKRYTNYDIVEVAHMELAEPTIKDAIQSCYSQECSHIVVAPYFLSPGRHVVEDIPRLVSEVAEELDGVTIEIADPIGAFLMPIQMHDEVMMKGSSCPRTASCDQHASCFVTKIFMLQELMGSWPN